MYVQGAPFVAALDFPTVSTPNDGSAVVSIVDYERSRPQVRIPAHIVIFFIIPR